MKGIQKQPGVAKKHAHQMLLALKLFSAMQPRSVQSNKK